MRAAVIQLNSQADKQQNLRKAFVFLDEALRRNADLILLPEVYNFRGGLNDKKRKENVFEKIPGPSTLPLMEFAKKQGVTILAGSIYEKSRTPQKAYNTSVLINRRGEICARYRKIHLFHAELGRASIKESRHFIPGRKKAIARVHSFSLGLSVCFDLRFPDLYQYYVKKGCSVFCVPSAFTASTGQYHWEALLKARAIETLSYVLAPNQTGTDERGITCYGRSMIISPWGEVLAAASETQEEVIVADINRKDIEIFRKKFPGYIKEKKHY